MDFVSSEIDSDGNGSGMDENGTEWEFRGIVSGSFDSDDEDSDEESEEEDP